MVRLFNGRETDFSHNEYVLNEIISCKVTEELNGDYTLELEYPLEDSKDISSNLVVGAIISVPTIDSRENQLFRIIKKETNSNSITVQAQAKLMADLKVNAIRTTIITGKTRKEAIQTILNSALDPHDYTVGNLDANTNTNVILEVKEGNLLSDIIGSENSVLSEYGGEFIVSNNTLDIVNKRGQDNGVVIEYGKNLSSIEENIDIADFATALIPKSGDYRLPEYLIVSPNAGAYDKLYYREVELNLNIWDGTNDKGDDQVTIEEAYELMRQACNKMFTVDKVDQIAFNYTVDFVQLSQTEEYKNYAILETVNLGDTVTIRHKKLNLDLQGRVNKITYRVNSEGVTTIDTVEIGFTRKDITDIIKDTVKQIKFAKDEIMLSVGNSINGLNSSIDLQAKKINAVVEQDGTGFGWELSKDAFKVACVGASDSFVEINEDGLEVHDGKFRLYKGNDVVFYVNTRGVCNAVGGFIVENDDTSCKLDKDGITLTNSNGYTSRFYVLDDTTALKMQDDLYIGKGIFVDGLSYFHTDVEIDGTLRIGEHLRVGGKDLIDIIDARITASK